MRRVQRRLLMKMTALGLKPEFVETVPPETLGRLTLLDEYDMSYIREKIVENSKGLIPPDGVDLAICELKRFFGLGVIFPRERLIPSKQIDAAWHEVILFTSRYRALCNSILDRVFDHFPKLPTDAPPDDRGFRRTLERYREAFGEPPPEMWGAIISPPPGSRRKALAVAGFATIASLTILILSVVVDWGRIKNSST